MHVEGENKWRRGEGKPRCRVRGFYVKGPEGLAEKVMFKQRPEEGEGGSHVCV